MENGYLIVIQVREVSLREFNRTSTQQKCRNSLWLSSLNRFLSDHARDVFRRGETV